MTSLNFLFFSLVYFFVSLGTSRLALIASIIPLPRVPLEGTEADDSVALESMVASCEQEKRIYDIIRYIKYILLFFYAELQTR
jgi:hypothetical protein